MTRNRFFSLSEARRFLALGLPVLVAQIAQMGRNFVDTAMTGRASTADMAAVAVSGSIWVPVSLLGMGCLLSLPAMMAHLVGGGEQRMSYDDIASILEGDRYFILLEDSRRGYILDKRTFASGELERFRSLIQSKTKKTIENV